MKDRAVKICYCGIAEYRDEAEALLKKVGDAAIVMRGARRSVVMQCPDGCGEILVINLDPRAGKAWKIDMRHDKMTIVPSVWKEGGCEAHFIIWRDTIVWCDSYWRYNVEPAYDPALERRVLETLETNRDRTIWDISDELDEIYWDVLRAVQRLVVQGLAEMPKGRDRHMARKR